MKKLSDSYLYQSLDYGKPLFQYLMSSERVDKTSSAFSDVEYAIKKQALPILYKVLLSKKVILLMSPKGTSRIFKVIYVKDPNEGGEERKVFIDCAGVITFENGMYVCKKISTLISYLTAAMTYVIYYNNPKAITTSVALTKSGAAAFVDMMLYVLGYLKVPIVYADNKQRMAFTLAEYYQTSVVGIDNSESVSNLAKNVANVQDKRSCDYLHTTFGFLYDRGCDIDQFLMKFAEVFMDQQPIEDLKEVPKNRVRLTTEAVAQRWMYSFGPGTVLGLECFVPFSQMLTDCYNGSYINQQNTIEKIAKSKTVVTFCNELFKIGSENA